MKDEYISSPLPSNAKTPEEAMEKVRFAPEEWLYVFGPKRPKMFKGDSNRVIPNDRFTPEFKDAVIVHNHIRGVSFSKEDVQSIISANVKEFIVVTPDHTYQVKRPKNGWPANLQEEFEKYWEISVRLAENMLMKLISMNEITLAERDVEEMHYIWSSFFKLNDIKYARKEYKKG